MNRRENIFDIAFEVDGQRYSGWVNPSGKLSDNGKPISFHVVLNNTSFGYLSYNNREWSVNEDRPAKLVKKAGEAIEKHLMMDIETNNDNTASQNSGETEKADKNAGSGAFNRGSIDDPHLNEGVADGTPNPEQVSKEKENPKSGKQG